MHDSHVTVSGALGGQDAGGIDGSNADQATGLRALFAVRPGLTMVPVAQVRRGMGSTTIVGHLASALARAGERPLVVDGTGHRVAGMFGLAAVHDLARVLEGLSTWREIAVEAPHGVYIARAQRALTDLATGALAAIELGQLYAGFRSSEPALAVALFAGPMREIAAITAVDDEIVIVTQPDEISLRATYAEVKRAHGEQHHAAFRVIVNRAHDERTGRAAFRRLADTTRRFIGIELEYGGTVARDPVFAAADRAQKTVFDVAPAGKAAQQLGTIVRSMRNWRLSRYAEGQ